MRIEWLPGPSATSSTTSSGSRLRTLWVAITASQAVEAAVERLGDFPDMAGSGRVRGTRQLIVVGTPYVVVYRIEPASVVILRVLHGAQRWPPS